jgi:hypothetical protein
MVMRDSRQKAWLLLLPLFLLVAFRARPARALDQNVAASAQLDYHLVGSWIGPNRSSYSKGAFDGFTMEASLKVAVDVSEHLSANVKFCYGCHGFEADMVYFDMRAFDELNVRVGRFSPSFGSFNLRHDPGNHKLSDKPLPYDMGRMLRNGAWNNGVLPSPFPDNGVEVNGAHWFGESVQLDYAVYAVTGFKQSTPNEIDLNFGESHSPYYVDNNSRPALGARIALTGKLGALSEVTLGASGMGGTYDPNGRLTYYIGGADLTARIDRTSIRFEYLVRRQEFDTTNPMLFKYPFADDIGSFFVKHGAFAEVEVPLSRGLDLVGRVDGLYRAGNVSAASELSSKSSVLRETLGLAFAIERNFRLKGSAETWQFNDPDAAGRRSDVSFHLGAVGTF